MGGENRRSGRFNRKQGGFRPGAGREEGRSHPGSLRSLNHPKPINILWRRSADPAIPRTATTPAADRHIQAMRGLSRRIEGSKPVN
eukprot:6669199-Pyramimonas_sp.AAC.1